MDKPPRHLASIGTYDELVLALRERACELRVAIGGENIAAVSGLADRYVQKLLGPRQVRRIGLVSLEPLLAALGVRLALIEDPEAMAKLEGRLVQSKPHHVRLTPARRARATAQPELSQ